MAYALRKKISPLIISLKPNYENNLKGIFNTNTKADHIYKQDELISLFEKIDSTITPGLNSQYVNNIIAGLPDNEISCGILPNNNSNEFYKMQEQGMLSEKEIVFLLFIVETKTFNYLWGWQEDSGVESFENWLIQNDYQINLYLPIYHSFVQLMANMELLEPSQFTSYDNVKEYKMKKEYIEEAFVFLNETKAISS